MSEGLLLGVDGGATKTVAVVADASGRVLGAGRSGSSDIHAAPDPDIAVDRVADAARQALRAAGVEGSDLAQAAFGLCGADWPEDMELYREGLTTRLRLSAAPILAAVPIIAIHRTQAIASSGLTTGAVHIGFATSKRFSAEAVIAGTTRISLLTPTPIGRVYAVPLTGAARANLLSPIARAT